jgi:hypothetical protein
MDESIFFPLFLCGFSKVVAEVSILPPLQPNEYLWKTHADKGHEKWEIFAWAARDVMAKVGHFGKHDQHYKEKIALYKYYTGALDTYYPKVEDESNKNNESKSENKKTQ